MIVKATLKVPTFDFAGYRAALHAHLAESLAQGAAKWLHATAEGPVPVFSGASRATFSALASHVGYVLSISPVAPSHIDIGIANGTAEFDTANWIYSFTYYTTLDYLVFNEYNNANNLSSPSGQPYFHLINPGPYHFQEKGRKEFESFARSLRAPSVSPFVSSNTVTV